ncbi:hypothetical protein SARC_07630 [Sphaeroforma arctica JP610]|uniref:Uncharacterized protein n=1 Tax=Sphaeroforma arctica JP610 TaxID=667725 RepID=A0A0L0FVN0_9EUKA|nr:hypothetical protein SARC_07630 [Sphaeroforma arctica JP610]KNC79998.1 hypothetical protein SARC_07630 [Sphaeroforma arctica JP610]|eukprot:XP_014153900.1 hypothetical protein SARC_07630 [Sphaeroforma arctica JP610]
MTTRLCTQSRTRERRPGPKLSSKLSSDSDSSSSGSSEDEYQGPLYEWNHKDARAFVPTAEMDKMRDVLQYRTRFARASVSGYAMGLYAVPDANDPELRNQRQKPTPLPLYYVSPSAVEHRKSLGVSDLKAGWYVKATEGQCFQVRVTPLHGEDSRAVCLGLDKHTRDTSEIICYLNIDGKACNTMGDLISVCTEYDCIYEGRVQEQKGRKTKVTQFKFRKISDEPVDKRENTTQGRANSDGWGTIMLEFTQAKKGKARHVAPGAYTPGTYRRRPNEEKFMKKGLAMGVGKGAVIEREEKFAGHVYNTSHKHNLPDQTLTIHIREQWWMVNKMILDGNYEPMTAEIAKKGMNATATKPGLLQKDIPREKLEKKMVKEQIVDCIDVDTGEVLKAYRAIKQPEPVKIVLDDDDDGTPQRDSERGRESGKSGSQGSRRRASLGDGVQTKPCLSGVRKRELHVTDVEDVFMREDLNRQTTSPAHSTATTSTTTTSPHTTKRMRVNGKGMSQPPLMTALSAQSDAHAPHNNTQQPQDVYAQQAQGNDQAPDSDADARAQALHSDPSANVLSVSVEDERAEAYNREQERLRLLFAEYGVDTAPHQRLHVENGINHIDNIPFFISGQEEQYRAYRESLMHEAPAAEEFAEGDGYAYDQSHEDGFVPDNADAHAYNGAPEQGDVVYEHAHGQDNSHTQLHTDAHGVAVEKTEVQVVSAKYGDGHEHQQPREQTKGGAHAQQEGHAEKSVDGHADDSNTPSAAQTAEVQSSSPVAAEAPTTTTTAIATTTTSDDAQANGAVENVGLSGDAAEMAAYAQARVAAALRETQARARIANEQARISAEPKQRERDEQARTEQDNKERDHAEHVRIAEEGREGTSDGDPHAGDAPATQVSVADEQASGEQQVRAEHSVHMDVDDPTGVRVQEAAVAATRGEVASGSVDVSRAASAVGEMPHTETVHVGPGHPQPEIVVQEQESDEDDDSDDSMPVAAKPDL